jgi:hypothetical protein
MDKKPIGENLTFKLVLHPSFDEHSEILLTKRDKIKQIQLLLLDRQIGGRDIDTFYFKTFNLSEMQVKKFDSLVLQKLAVNQPIQWNGCCDGMTADYELVRGFDTLNLHFRFPNEKSDSIGFLITTATIANLRTLYADSLIDEYLNDIESYIDEYNKPHSRGDDSSALSRLRNSKYSR